MEEVFLQLARAAPADHHQATDAALRGPRLGCMNVGWAERVLAFFCGVDVGLAWRQWLMKSRWRPMNDHSPHQRNHGSPDQRQSHSHEHDHELGQPHSHSQGREGRGGEGQGREGQAAVELTKLSDEVAGGSNAQDGGEVIDIELDEPIRADAAGRRWPLLEPLASALSAAQRRLRRRRQLDGEHADTPLARTTRSSSSPEG